MWFKTEDNEESDRLRNYSKSGSKKCKERIIHDWELRKIAKQQKVDFTIFTYAYYWSYRHWPRCCCTKLLAWCLDMWQRLSSSTNFSERYRGVASFKRRLKTFISWRPRLKLMHKLAWINAGTVSPDAGMSIFHTVIATSAH